MIDFIVGLTVLLKVRHFKLICFFEIQTPVKTFLSTTDLATKGVNKCVHDLSFDKKK